MSNSQAMEFVSGLTGHERSALRQFMRDPVKYKTLVLMAATHVLPLDRDPDSLVRVEDWEQAVTTLAAALCMMGGATARH